MNVDQLGPVRVGREGDVAHDLVKAMIVLDKLSESLLQDLGPVAVVVEVAEYFGVDLIKGPLPIGIKVPEQSRGRSPFCPQGLVLSGIL